MTDTPNSIRDILKHYIGNYVTADEYENDVNEANQAINAYILNQIIGADEAETRGATQDPTNPKYWTKRTKVRNELRQELRNKANKKWGK